MKILSMSGFIPEQICDTVRFTQFCGDRNISHYCGYASDFISQVLQDESIDGAVFPKSCDSTRIISSYLAGSGKFIFQLGIPVYHTVGAEDYFAESIRAYKEALENYYGIKICDIKERTEKINQRNASISKLYEHLGEISFAAYLESIHGMLKKPLEQQEVPSDFKTYHATDKRVFVVGSFLSNTDLARQMEAAGLTVVGDTLPESGRLVSIPSAGTKGDIYKSIASNILAGRLAPSQNGFQTIINKDLDEIKKKSVKGVIFITQKYCEAYDYLYSVYKSVLDFMDISVIQVSINDTEDSRKAALAFEAFADIIS